MPPDRLMNDDEKLAYENLQAAFHKLRTTAVLASGQKSQLEEALEALFWRALPYFRMRPDANPVHHHTQVLDNMVGITLGELPDGFDSRMLLSAYVLGLLHDIGNGICERQKITTDETDAIMDQARECPDPAHRETLEQEAVRIALQAIAFRLEHMDKGPALIRDVTRDLVNRGFIQDSAVHVICRAVVIHDYPTIEDLMKNLRTSGLDTGFAPGDFLLPLDKTPFGKLTAFLREADRLWMVTDQGVLKDLRDGGLDPTEENIRNERESNARKHRKEYGLYQDVGRSDGFIEQTLYRTKTGYGMFVDWTKKGK